MAKDQLTIFACENGDCILIEADGRRILTDVRYTDRAEDNEDELPDVGAIIRDACADNHLHIFVLTHPDEDHLGGFTKLFHTGKPERHDDDPKEGPCLILVDEIWCSPHATRPNYETDASRPLLREIKRRLALQGTEEGSKNGNRLAVMDSSTKYSGQLTSRIAWNLLAPTVEEATIKPTADSDRPSTNNSSLVIRWSITVGTRDNLVLLGGDASVDVWERIYDDNKNSKARFQWHILIAPHHCSRGVFGRKDIDSGEYEDSESARLALSGQVDDGWVVSSSKCIKRNDDNPPSWEAKQKYLKILARDGDVTDDVKDRFLCTGDYTSGDPGNIVFRLTSNGPTEKRAGAPAIIVGSGGGGGYGQGCS